MNEEKDMEIVVGNDTVNVTITPKKVLREILSWVMWIGGAVLLAFVFNHTIIVNAEVISGSMESTIMTNDRVVGLRTAYWFGRPDRFDVVVFRNPNTPDDFQEPGLITRMTAFLTNPFRAEQNRIISPEPYVKRIIGMPNETVEIREGGVFIDDVLLEGDTFARDEGWYVHGGTWRVPDGHYFVLGDNRNHSSDSRQGWLLPREDIIGKIYFAIYPNFNTMR